MSANSCGHYRFYDSFYSKWEDTLVVKFLGHSPPAFYVVLIPSPLHPFLTADLPNSTSGQRPIRFKLTTRTRILIGENAKQDRIESERCYVRESK